MEIMRRWIPIHEDILSMKPFPAKIAPAQELRRRHRRRRRRRWEWLIKLLWTPLIITTHAIIKINPLLHRVPSHVRNHTRVALRHHLLRRRLFPHRTHRPGEHDRDRFRPLRSSRVTTHRRNDSQAHRRPRLEALPRSHPRLRRYHLLATSIDPKFQRRTIRFN